MMKILVISDSHGDRTGLHWLLEQIHKDYGFFDAYIHCGDGNHDFDVVRTSLSEQHQSASLFVVKGNCDYTQELSEQLIVSLENCKILITHGHLYQVKSTLTYVNQKAVTEQCHVVLYGHTHKPNLEMRGALLMNPGSVRDGKAAILEIEGSHAKGMLLAY